MHDHADGPAKLDGAGDVGSKHFSHAACEPRAAPELARLVAADLKGIIDIITKP